MAWQDQYQPLIRKVGDDEWLFLIDLTLGRARLCVGNEFNASLEHW